MDSIPFPDKVSPAWLTSVLCQHGYLDRGEVVSVDISNTGAFNSQTQRLNLRFSPDAPNTAPTRLVLKRNTPDAWSKEAGADEVKFYRWVVQIDGASRWVTPYYAAEYDQATGDSYLLLKDLSDTHAPPVTRDQQISILNGIPRIVDQEAVIDTLARLHGYFWDHAQIKTGTFEVGFWSRDADRFSRYLERRKNSWNTLMTKEGPGIPPDIDHIYQSVFVSLPHFWETYLAPRFQTLANLTLIHGDTYFANFLCPKIAGNGVTYLLDWQSPSWDLAAYDLVNLLATFWTRAQRQDSDREINLLRRYYAGLIECGVINYTWKELLADYRACLIFWILMPVQDAADGASKEYWEPKMRCLLDAFKDWHCEELL